MNGEPLMSGQMDTANMPVSKRRMDDEVEWNLVDSVRKVLRGRRVLLIYTLVGMGLGVLIAFIWPHWYAAQAVFLPPRTTETMPSSASVSALMSQDPSDMYLGMLKSRSVADDVIDHAGLMTIYRAKTRADARLMLERHSKFTVGKTTLMSVEITAPEPELAATIGNAYLDALYRLNGSMVASAAEHRRLFLEEQLGRQKEALDQAEVALKQVQERTGIVLPVGEAQAGLKATADLQAAIGVAEARLSGVRVGATENNPRVIQARAELAELKSQLARQRSSSSKENSRQGLASSSALPGLTLEYAQKMREVKLNETLYDSLTAQYEKARISSLDPGPQLQIVDRAIVAERKAGPPRKLIVLGGIVLGFFAGLAYLLFTGPLERLIRICLSDPAPATER